MITILVASPDDVTEERDRLESIINDINSSHARRTGIRLELLRWERDVSPAMGEDAQAVINSQIPEDYDVFLGIFWNRFGSPTNRAESGTVEEFEKAKERFDNAPRSIRLMLYFKDSPPLTMDGFDADQYKMVQEFRSRVEKEAIYKKFSTTEDFGNFVRLDRTKLVLDGTLAYGGTEDSLPAEQKGGILDEEFRSIEDDGAEEEGYLELQESLEDEMGSLSATLNRMSGSIEDIGAKINQRVKEINVLGIPKDATSLSKNERQKMRADAIRIMKRCSNDLNRFVAQMSQNIPLFQRHLDKSINIFAKAVPIYLELNEDEDKQGLKGTIKSMLDAMEGMLQSMQGFHHSVARLPKLTTTLGRSKRKTERVLQEVIDIARGGRTSLEGVLSMLP